MKRIQNIVLEAYYRHPVTPDELLDLSMDYIREVLAAPDGPQDIALASDLARRATAICSILLAASARLPEGQRRTAFIALEVTPRESEVCCLIARGEIDVHSAEIQ